MFRLLTSIILVGIAVAVFLTFTSPLYNDISALRAQVASYNEALDNSKALENERDKLTKKYNSLNPDNLVRLVKLLPNNVDNIRLILEIEKIATPYGMALKDVKYSTDNPDTVAEKTPVAGVKGGGVATALRKDYGTWNLGFTVQGTYNNFVNFLKDLEKNLRIVDITSVDFSSKGGVGASPSLSEIYKYDLQIKTYWLKN
jgi:Tfp pilus assembly protein PilO